MIKISKIITICEFITLLFNLIQIRLLFKEKSKAVIFHKPINLLISAQF